MLASNLWLHNGHPLVSNEKINSSNHYWWPQPYVCTFSSTIRLKLLKLTRLVEELWNGEVPFQVWGCLLRTKKNEVAPKKEYSPHTLNWSAPKILSDTMDRQRHKTNAPTPLSSASPPLLISARFNPAASSSLHSAWPTSPDDDYSSSATTYVGHARSSVTISVFSCP
jgi:hypothetical protein